MSYTRTQKACQDAPVGFRQVDALIDNLDDVKTRFEVQHWKAANVATAVVGLPGHPPSAYTLTPGRHDTPLVARGVAFVQGSVTNFAFNAFLQYSTPLLTSMQHIDAGTYFFPITGYSKVWGKATHQQGLDSGGGPGFARCVPSNVGYSGGTGLFVYTYFVTSTGSANDRLDLFDSGFYLVAYGRR
jgi:hypothetical protein